MRFRRGGRRAREGDAPRRGDAGGGGDRRPSRPRSRCAAATSSRCPPSRSRRPRTCAPRRGARRQRRLRLAPRSRARTRWTWSPAAPPGPTSRRAARRRRRRSDRAPPCVSPGPACAHTSWPRIPGPTASYACCAQRLPRPAGRSKGCASSGRGRTGRGASCRTPFALAGPSVTEVVAYRTLPAEPATAGAFLRLPGARRDRRRDVHVAFERRGPRPRPRAHGPERALRARARGERRAPRRARRCASWGRPRPRRPDPDRRRPRGGGGERAPQRIRRASMSYPTPPSAAAAAHARRSAASCARRRLSVDDLVAPLFVCPGEGVRRAHRVDARVLPPQRRRDRGRVPRAAPAGRARRDPVRDPRARRTRRGASAFDEDGVVPRALRAVRREVPELLALGGRLPLRVHGPRPLRAARAGPTADGRGQRPDAARSSPRAAVVLRRRRARTSSRPRT